MANNRTQLILAVLTLFVSIGFVAGTLAQSEYLGENLYGVEIRYRTTDQHQIGYVLDAVAIAFLCLVQVMHVGLLVCLVALKNVHFYERADAQGREQEKYGNDLLGCTDFHDVLLSGCCPCVSMGLNCSKLGETTGGVGGLLYCGALCCSPINANCVGGWSPMPLTSVLQCVFRSRALNQQDRPFTCHDCLSICVCPGAFRLFC